MNPKIHENVTLQVLDDLGLQYGQPEVAKVLEYCVINVDGFVAYKDLIKKFSPDTPRAKQAETEQFVLKANDIAMQRDNGDAEVGGSNNNMPPVLYDMGCMKEFLVKQTEEIRRLYSRWDRGMLTDRAFVTALEHDLHMPLTEEFRHMMSVHGPSRNLSFAKLMTSLRIENFLGKSQKNRTAPTKMPEKVYTNLPGADIANANRPSYDLREFSEPIETGRQPQMSQTRRNPITWEDNADDIKTLQGNVKTAPNLHMGQNLASDFASDRPPRLLGSMAPGLQNQYDRDSFLRQAIYNFCDGKYNSWVFRQQLAEAGVLITIEVDRLIRQHESDNSTRVADYIAIITRNEKTTQLDPRSPRYRDEMSSKRTAADNREGFAADTQALQTPYATDLTVSEKVAVNNSSNPSRHAQENILTWNKQAPRKPNKALMPDHIAHRTGGDIIAWRTPAEGQKHYGERPTSPSTSRGANTDDQGEKEMNIINWNGGSPTNLAEHYRTGKKCFRSMQTEHSAPFGTDADHGKTAEECHTLEYRPATHHESERRAYGV